MNQTPLWIERPVNVREIPVRNTTHQGWDLALLGTPTLPEGNLTQDLKQFRGRPGIFSYLVSE